MEKKKKTERLVANLKDNESYLLEHCLSQEEGMSNYLKKLVIKDMQGDSSDVVVDDNLVAKRLLDMLFEHNYSLVAPSAQNSFKQEVNVSANTPERLTIEKKEEEVFETQEFEDDDFLD